LGGAVKILAVDTALGACSVAMLDNEQVLAHRLMVMERGHAEALAPMVEAAMQDANLAFASIDRLAVTTGPGTFTGQRIGIAFMRGLRVALDKPLIGVTTLSAMAHQAMAETGRTIGAAVHDARRDEVYLEVAGEEQSAPCVLLFKEAVERVAQIRRPFVLAGTAAKRMHEQVRAAALSNVLQPDALWVAKLAQRMSSPPMTPRPLYLRAPDAKLPVRK
jgi:tRNA threonylcarbamoyladenosine biosynthesis protein TsaB